jgi:uncharacterized protein
MNKFILPLIVVALATANYIYPQKTDGVSQKQQFIYVLHLEKSMQDSTTWTPDKMKIAQEHFAHLQKLLTDGVLILGGRTQMPFTKTFGIVVYEADSFEEAKAIAENDPAVKGKIMTVEVYPYKVALMRNCEKK